MYTNNLSRYSDGFNFIWICRLLGNYHFCWFCLADGETIELLWQLRAQRRQASPTLPETVTRLTAPDGSLLYLVGTAHFSDSSKNDVATVSQWHECVWNRSCYAFVWFQSSVYMPLCLNRTCHFTAAWHEQINETITWAIWFIRFHFVFVFLKQYAISGLPTVSASNNIQFFESYY